LRRARQCMGVGSIWWLGRGQRCWRRGCGLDSATAAAGQRDRSGLVEGGFSHHAGWIHSSSACRSNCLHTFTNEGLQVSSGTADLFAVRRLAIICSFRHRLRSQPRILPYTEPARLAKRRSLSRTVSTGEGRRCPVAKGPNGRSGRFRVRLHALSARKSKLGGQLGGCFLTGLANLPHQQCAPPANIMRTAWSTLRRPS
jgi:hypothetical protein